MSERQGINNPAKSLTEIHMRKGDNPWIIASTIGRYLYIGALHVFAETRFVDIGCGTHMAAIVLSEWFRNFYHGVDYDSQLITTNEAATTHLGNMATFETMDAVAFCEHQAAMIREGIRHPYDIALAIRSLDHLKKDRAHKVMQDLASIANEAYLAFSVNVTQEEDQFHLSTWSAQEAYLFMMRTGCWRYVDWVPGKMRLLHCRESFILEHTRETSALAPKAMET